MAEVFVFGSNLAGRHGKGAALAARNQYGAITGRGEGLMGGCYAIPTKDARLSILSLPSIAAYVERFLIFAEKHQEMTFRVTPIGCGLAGYVPAQIAPMFKRAGANVHLPSEFMTVFAEAGDAAA